MIEENQVIKTKWNTDTNNPFNPIHDDLTERLFRPDVKNDQQKWWKRLDH